MGGSQGIPGHGIDIGTSKRSPGMSRLFPALGVALACTTVGLPNADGAVRGRTADSPTRARRPKHGARAWRLRRGRGGPVRRHPRERISPACAEGSTRRSGCDLMGACLHPSQRCGRGRGRAGRSALAVGAGPSGGNRGALLPGRAGEIPGARPVSRRRWISIGGILRRRRTPWRVS